VVPRPCRVVGVREDIYSDDAVPVQSEPAGDGSTYTSGSAGDYYCPWCRWSLYGISAQDVTLHSCQHRTPRGDNRLRHGHEAFRVGLAASGLELSGPPQEPANVWGPLKLRVCPASLGRFAYLRVSTQAGCSPSRPLTPARRKGHEERGGLHAVLGGVRNNTVIRTSSPFNS